MAQIQNFANLDFNDLTCWRQVSDSQKASFMQPLLCYRNFLSSR